MGSRNWGGRDAIESLPVVRFIFWEMGTDYN